ncbi:hypothetical protein YDYSY3_06700 [Paenibacillus chitinolyticus]|nr:hypothetical protein YDYSY3_06700 [Paenibacillus chitinolyticus]
MGAVRGNQPRPLHPGGAKGPHAVQQTGGIQRLPDLRGQKLPAHLMAGKAVPVHQQRPPSFLRKAFSDKASG